MRVYPRCTVYRIVYTYSHRDGGGGGGWTRENVGGATVQKSGSKITTLLTVTPVDKVWQAPAAKSLYMSVFWDDDILLWCLYSLLVNVSGRETRRKLDKPWYLEEGELTEEELEKEHLLVGRILHHFMRAVYYNTHEITEVVRGYVPFSAQLIVGGIIL